MTNTTAPTSEGLLACPFCGAYPHLRDDLVTCENDECPMFDMVGEFSLEQWNTRAPSAPDRLAGDGAACIDGDRESVIACLGDDAATLRDDGQYFEIADNMNRAARMLSAPAIESNARADGGEPSREWLLNTSDKFAAWCNDSGDALRELMSAYERRVRSACTADDIAKKPWECAEYIEAQRVLDRKPVWEVVIPCTAINHIGFLTRGSLELLRCADGHDDFVNLWKFQRSEQSVPVYLAATAERETVTVSGMDESEEMNAALRAFHEAKTPRGGTRAVLEARLRAVLDQHCGTCPEATIYCESIKVKNEIIRQLREQLAVAPKAASHPAEGGEVGK
jgi:hypothetical protein